VRYFDDYHELVDTHDFQAASLAVQPEQNVMLVTELANRGIHIMCEKPVAPNIAEMNKLVEIINKTKIKFTFAAPMTVFSDAFRSSIAAVKSNAIGEPRIAYFQFLQPNGPLFTLSPERCKQTDRAELANFGPYGLLAFLKMFNSPVVSVFARADALFYDHYKENNLEDMAMLSLECENGAIGNIVVGRTTTTGLPRTDLRMQVIGSDGVINIEDGLGYAIDAYVDKTHKRISYGTQTQTLYVDDFVKSIIDDCQPQITCQDAHAVIAILDAAYESAKTGRKVRLSGI
jgi:predicted dehydrogenase